MSKRRKSAGNRSIEVGKSATGSAIVSGDNNVATIGSSNGPSDGQPERTVPKVFISSTSEDLKPHRAAARDAGIAAGFLPIQMEYFPASGEHLPLETCLEKVTDADLLVVIVAHRYGWVPPDQGGDEHKSITWLECEQARAGKDKKEVLAFVVDKKHAWDPQLKEYYRIAAAVSEGKATPELLVEVQRNVERLRDFKGWIDSIGVRAKFTTPEDLGWKVAEALREWKQRHARPHHQPPDESRPQTRRPTFPATYRQWLQKQCADIDLLGVRLKQGQAVKLNHVYVPPITSVEDEDPLPTGKLRKRPQPDDIVRSEGREKPQLLLEQLDKHSLYVPGDPGAGKSTFCRWVAWLVAAGSMPPGEVAAPEDYTESFPRGLAERLPLLVRLRDVWSYLPQDAGRESLSQAKLESALGNWLDTANPGGLDWTDVTPHLQNGSTLLIFDGIDEVPLRVGEGRGACYPRATLLAGLTADADRVKPFHLPALKRYKPFFLAGWLSEEYSVDRDTALERCKHYFYRREQENVAAFMPGDTHRDLDVEVWFSKANSDLILLPLYLLSYRYRDKLYRFMINGQTGKVDGDKPISKKRIAVAVCVGLGLIAVIVLLMMLLSGR